jgi:hypothetical protein
MYSIGIAVVINRQENPLTSISYTTSESYLHQFIKNWLDTH